MIFAIFKQFTFKNFLFHFDTHLKDKYSTFNIKHFAFLKVLILCFHFYSSPLPSSVAYFGQLVSSNFLQTFSPQLLRGIYSKLRLWLTILAFNYVIFYFDASDIKNFIIKNWCLQIIVFLLCFPLISRGMMLSEVERGLRLSRINILIFWCQH